MLDDKPVVTVLQLTVKNAIEITPRDVCDKFFTLFPTDKNGNHTFTKDDLDKLNDFLNTTK